jgi:hypothetical protein
MYDVNMLVAGFVLVVLFSDNTLKLASTFVGGTHEVIFNHRDIANAPLSKTSPDLMGIGTMALALKMGCEEVVSAMVCFCCM